MDTGKQGQFVAEAALANPDVEVLGEYVNRRTHIEVRCRKCGAVWLAPPYSLLKGHGCRRCAGNARKTTAEFVDELSSVNPNIEVLGEYVNNRTPIEVRCRVCGKRWPAKPLHLLHGHGCRDCHYRGQSERQFKSNEQFLRELKSANDSITPLEEYRGALSRIHVRCDVCGYDWLVTPASLLSNGTGCPRCARRLRWTTDSFCAEMANINPDIEVVGSYVNNHTPIEVRCRLCGQTWKPRPMNLLRGAGCPKCFHGPTSFAEQFILRAFRLSLGDTDVLWRDNGTIGQELDILIPSHSLAIEPGSWYWHEDRLDRDVLKRKLCAEKGVRLITVYDAFPPGERPPFEFDCRTFSMDLGAERGHGTLKELVQSIADDAGIPLSLEDADWRDVEVAAYEASRGLTTEEFAERLAAVNPGIEVLEEYGGTQKKIEVRCRICGQTWRARPSGLLVGYGCSECSKRRVAESHVKTDDQYKREVREKFPTIEVLGTYTRAKDPIMFRCTVCGHEWARRAGRMLASTGCPKCMKQRRADARRMTHSEFETRMAKVDPTIEVVGAYEGSDKPIHVRCTICGREWDPKPTDLLSGKGCGSCKRKIAARNRTKSNDQFLADLAQKRPDIESVDTYRGIDVRIRFRCKLCGNVWSRTPHKILSGSGCPKCHGRPGLSGI